MNSNCEFCQSGNVNLLAHGFPFFSLLTVGASFRDRNEFGQWLCGVGVLVFGIGLILGTLLHDSDFLVLVVIIALMGLACVLVGGLLLIF